MNSDYFVKVNDPTTHRVMLLETSKLVIGALKSYHRTLFLRKQKTAKVEQLKNQVKELLLLLQKVEELLPHEHLPDDNLTELKIKKQQMSSPVKKTGIQEISSEAKISRLNKTLEDIEKRLKNIN